jgi:hypothetical protein
MMQSILGLINQAISMDDKALEAAGGTRPQTIVDPVFPETQAGITLEQLDAPFIALIDTANAQEPMTTPESIAQTDNNPTDEVEVIDADLSASETETVVQESISLDESINPDTGTQPPVGLGSETAILPDVLLQVPIMEPSGPYTQGIRDTLDELAQVVQQEVDQLNAEKQAAEAERQSQLDEMQRQMDSEPSQPAPEPAPSEEANNLLDEGGGETGQ